MSQPGIRWDVPPEEAWGDLADEYITALHAGVLAIAQRWAPEIENGQTMRPDRPHGQRATDALHRVRQVANEMVS